MPFEVGFYRPPKVEKSFTVGERKEEASLNNLPDEFRNLLDGPVTAVLTTLGKSGKPQMSPVWILHDGDHIYINVAKGRAKDKNMRARPDIGLVLMNPENPYHWMSINARVEEVLEETDSERRHLAVETLDDASELYINTRPYPLRDPAGGEIRVLFKIKPEKVLLFGSP